MSKQKIHSKIELKNFRRELRHNLTPAEAFLWTQLKARKLNGRRFTKQHSINNYIVDFYCASEKIIIELDGEVTIILMHRNMITKERFTWSLLVIKSSDLKTNWCLKI